MATGRQEERRLVGELLRQMRLEAGLRQQDLAERLGVRQSFVSKYESGERYLGVLEVRQICAALGGTLGSFVERLEAQLEAAVRPQTRKTKPSAEDLGLSDRPPR